MGAVTDAWTRPLDCTRCGNRWLVSELPRPFIDPDLFVCADCLRPVGAPRQLELVADGDARTEVREYDPDISAIPF